MAAKITFCLQLSCRGLWPQDQYLGPAEAHPAAQEGLCLGKGGHTKPSSSFIVD
jgi:hypothetical protein